MTIERASDNPFPSILMVEGDPEALASDPAVGQRRLVVGLDHLLYLVDPAGVASPAAAAADLDTVIAASSGQDVADALAGAAAPDAGNVFATMADVGGGGISSGTSNPGSPSNGDLFFRSDLDLFIRYRSSGTRWVCTCPHVQNIAHQDQLTPATVTHSFRAAFPYPITTDMLVESVAVTCLVNTTLSGSQYWTFAMPNGTTLTTISLAANTLLKLGNQTQLVVALSSGWADCTATKVSTPGSVFYAASFSYRYIVT